MDFFLINNDTDGKIKEIKQKLLLSMNGIVSDKMKESGIIYKKNYGVSIPRILEISKSYAPDSNLAQALWAMQIRETMMLSVMIEPVKIFKPDLAKKRISEINQLDLAEFASMYLFSRLSYSNELCLYCVFSDKLWHQINGFMIAARIVDNLNENEIKSITDRVFELSKSNEFQLYRSMAVCLSRLCRKDKEIANNIYKSIEKFNTSEISGEQYIFENVMQEIEFLNLL